MESLFENTGSKSQVRNGSNEARSLGSAHEASTIESVCVAMIRCHTFIFRRVIALPIEGISILVAVPRLADLIWPPAVRIPHFRSARSVMANAPPPSNEHPGTMPEALHINTLTKESVEKVTHPSPLAPRSSSIQTAFSDS